MNPLEVAAVAVITVGSRIASLALLPSPEGRLAAFVRRLPAPLFAALAAHSLVSVEDGITDPALLAAVVLAVIASRWSSLLITLAAGLAGYLVVSLVW